jgi:hypothetical protein
MVLVTHDMSKLEEYCDTAVLLHEGRVEEIGDADAVGRRYMELNFATGETATAKTARSRDEFAGSAGITDFRFENDAGEGIENLQQGESIWYRGEIEIYEPIGHLGTIGAGTLIVALNNADDQRVFEVRSDPLTSSDGPLLPGEKVLVRGRIENKLVGGRYTADVAMTSFPQGDMTIAFRNGAASLLIYGTESSSGGSGLFVPDHELQIERKADPAAQLSRVDGQPRSANPDDSVANQRSQNA